MPGLGNRQMLNVAGPERVGHSGVQKRTECVRTSRNTPNDKTDCSKGPDSDTREGGIERPENDVIPSVPVAREDGEDGHSYGTRLRDHSEDMALLCQRERSGCAKKTGDTDEEIGYEGPMEEAVRELKREE